MVKAATFVIDKVIDGNYCVGCGLCRHAAPDEFESVLDGIGRVQAIRIGSAPDSSVDQICPFSDHGPHEDELAAMLFSNSSNHSREIGAYEALYAGHVREGQFRKNGSSGGMGTWIVTELLRLQLVDVVVSVGPKEDTYAFQFANSVTVDELGLRSKSRYYPVTFGNELTDAFRFKRVAIVGLPCFIKGIRRLAEAKPDIKPRLAFTVALVCGHLKTRSFGQLLAWQLGVHPSALSSIDYRLKLPERAASRYGVTVWSREGRKIDAPMERLIGQNWGHGLFKVAACDYCDDVFGETADISIGDAWLPQYESDSAGTNIVVVRNAKLVQLVEVARGAGRLHLEPVTVAAVADSQAGGLRHRRDGLRYRLALKKHAGLWVPRKRVTPSVDHLQKKTQEIQDARMHVRDLSHTLFAAALQKNDLRVFVDGIRPAIAALDRLQRLSPAQRFASAKHRAINMAKKFFRVMNGK